MHTETRADPAHSKALPDLVDKLLDARQQSLLLYQKLAALKPFTQIETVTHLLRRFRQALIDYLALGPFEVYQALEEQPADSPYGPARALARQLYARIASTTQVALNFHDGYDGELSAPALAGLGAALSQLGEQLARRIELEDRILSAIRRAADAA